MPIGAFAWRLWHTLMVRTARKREQEFIWEVQRDRGPEKPAGAPSRDGTARTNAIMFVSGMFVSGLRLSIERDMCMRDMCTPWGSARGPHIAPMRLLAQRALDPAGHREHVRVALWETQYL